MENASKALIMAGEILIAMVIVGLAVVIISKTGSFSANINDRIAADKVAEFNQHFTKYEGRIDITAEEIATIINFAKNSNDKNELSYDDMGTNNQSVYWVDVSINGAFSRTDKVFGGYINKTEYENDNAFKSKLNQFIRAFNTTYFYCNVDYSSREKEPAVVKLPDGNKKGKIRINLSKDDISYSANTKDKTLLVNKITFGITNIDDRNWLDWPAGITEEEKQEIRQKYGFTVRNDARKMYTYTYN